MSAVEDDFERALWNNQFYSSATVLTESSSSNHLSNLKKQANISNSVSMQSLSDHVKSPNAGSLRSEKFDKSEVPTSSIQVSRTSLMKLSPSIKALEKVLNSDSTSVKMPPVITEEDEEEEEEEEEKQCIDGYTNVADLKHRGMYENSNHSDLESKGFNGIQLNHPRASYSSFSLSTLHTAKCTVALDDNEELQGFRGTSQVSVTTQGAPGDFETEDETRPKLLPPARITSSQSLGNERNDSRMYISNEAFEDNQPFENERLASRHHLESPSIKTMILSKSCPALSEKIRLSEALSMDEEIASYLDTLEEPIDLHSSSRKDRNIQSSAEPDKVSANTPKSQRPVRSLLDSSFLGQPETSLKPQKPMSSVNNEGHFVSREHTQTSSKSNAPQSLAPSSHSRTKSDAGVPKSPSFFSSHKRVPSQDVSDMLRGVGLRKNSTQDMVPVTAQAKVSIHKRFSFRGLFKVKSKHPPPVKPKVAQDDSQKPSVPAKLTAKSFSTPNMSGLAYDVKTQTIPENDVGVSSVQPRHDNKRNLFKRRESTSTISHMEADPRIKLQKAGTTLTASTGITIGTAPIGKAIAPSRKKPPMHNLLTMSKPQTDSPPVPPQKREDFEIYSKPRTPHNRETIREVDDSDYSPNITRNSSIPQTPEKSAPTDGESTNRSEDADDVLEQYSPFNSGNFFTTESNSSPLFGSPFRVTFPTERPESNSPRMQMAFKLEPPQSPDRSVVSKGSSEQLAGETVFPKSLDAAEIESIVSLERSRSMRSIRSNKRSSFMNYNGSDDNIVLAKNLGTVLVTQGSMRRSGSILKNSPSTQSLLSETYPSIEAKFAEAPDESFAISDISADPPEPARSPSGDDDLVNFIEFSDYIDFDNLNFSPSPLPNTIKYGKPASSFSGIYVEDEVETAPRSSQYGKGNLETHFEGPLETSELVSISETVSDGETSTAIDTTASVTQSKSMAAAMAMAMAKNLVSDPKEFPLRSHSLPLENHEVVLVTSRTSSEFDTSRAVSDDINADISQASFDKPGGVSIENPGIASPIEKTFKFATDDDNQESMARPVSMSFKGFHGSAFKDRVLPQSGSHQSINFDEESTNEESVGRGFGSSEEDSDGDCESFEVQENKEHFHIAADKPQSSSQEPKKMNSFDRRQQHIKNVLDLQPPPASLKLRHNRIPSLSDQSSISSPKSLTSFISRMRKSPMPSPKMPLHRPRVKFSSRIILYDTYHHDEYDRHPEIATCNQLTPQLAQQIKQELNELKAHMEVHQDSACYTQFF